MKANFGYKLRNKNDLDYESDRHSTEEVATVCKGDESKINSFTVNRLSGVSLIDYEQNAEELVGFLERAYPVRINKIVLDFITDKYKRNVLFNVKYIDSEHTKASEKDAGEKKRTLDELTCSVYCKLCGLIFKKDEASKTLTYKLLWELAQHLKKRGRQLKGIEVSHSSTRPCRVCDLCYMVVVSEHELIELEQQFARVQNIPITDPYLRVPIEKKAKHRPALLSENLKQWRFMIYLQNLYFEEDNLFETNKVNTKDIHLQIKLFRIKNDFTLDLDIPLNRDNSGRVDSEFDYSFAYEINLLRVYYFFSESTDIKTFLQDTELQVRLTHTGDWNNYIAQGSTKTLSHFENGRIRGQKHESLIYMFFDSADYCTVKFMAGLVCDGDFNTASMNLHKYNGIYFPNDDFYNCNIFPEEWIEIFMGEGDKYELEDYDTQEKKVQPYTPVCTQAELKKMLEPNHRSTKYSEIETRIDNRLDKAKYEYDKERIRQERLTKRSRPFSNYTALEEAPMPKEFRIKADISKPQTADPRKGKAATRERSADLNRGMKNQVKTYLEGQQDKTIIGQPGKTIRQELFDESEVYMGLEDEYGPAKDTEGKKRLVSAQDHKQFLMRQQQLLKDDRKAY